MRAEIDWRKLSILRHHASRKFAASPRGSTTGF
jgi:hypothetical protein